MKALYFVIHKSLCCCVSGISCRFSRMRRMRGYVRGLAARASWPNYQEYYGLLVCAPSHMREPSQLQRESRKPSLPSSLWVAPKDLPRLPGYLGLRHLGLVAAGAMPLSFLLLKRLEWRAVMSSMLEETCWCEEARPSIVVGTCINRTGHPRPHSCIAVAGPN